MNVTMPVWLLDDVALGVTGELALQIPNRGDTFLTRDIDLIFGHAKEIVVLEITDCSETLVHRVGCTFRDYFPRS